MTDYRNRTLGAHRGTGHTVTNKFVYIWAAAAAPRLQRRRRRKIHPDLSSRRQQHPYDEIWFWCCMLGGAARLVTACIAHAPGNEFRTCDCMCNGWVFWLKAIRYVSYPCVGCCLHQHLQQCIFISVRGPPTAVHPTTLVLDI